MPALPVYAAGMKMLTIPAAAALAFAASSPAALRVVSSAPAPDTDIPSAGATQMVAFTTTETVRGFGLDARWVPVSASGGGSAPWSTDLAVTVTAPGGEMMDWPMVGGEISIASYPLSDAAGTLAGSNTSGTYTFQFSGTPSPYTAGLRDLTLHALAETPDVVEIINGSTLEGPQWDRPFSIVGISGQGPVNYETLEFEVTEAGLYTFESVRADSTDNFTFLYEGEFEPTLPLMNMLDYGLGNGFAPNESPQGTSLIESLLFPGCTYTLVNSQWAFFRPGGPYTLTITGPAALAVATDCPADFTDDGAVNGSDLAVLLAAWGTPGADLTGDGTTNGSDLAVLLAAWGVCE